MIAELERKSVEDNKLMRVLKLSEISYPIARTSKGELSLKLAFGGAGKDYRITLDSVPLDKKTSDTIITFYKDKIL